MPKIVNLKYSILNKAILFVCIIFSLPLYCFGWGLLGHRIIGQIAERYLTPKARANVHKILGNESLAMASTWADFIKSDSAYNYLSAWHYIDFDSGWTKEQIQAYLRSDTAVDIYTKINSLVRELKGKRLSADQLRMDLKLLIHLVGDVHQPFHVGRRGDLGGNKIKLSWFTNPSNLHSVWDEQLINFQQLSYTEYAAAINYPSVRDRTDWQKQPVSDWLIESYQIAERLYGEVRPDAKLGYRYNYDHIKMLNERLLKAGVRLAALLNRLFG